MKQILTITLAIGFGMTASAQSYPNPDFNNEVYALRKDSGKLTRLEKASSQIHQKNSFMGGGSMQYDVEAKQSPVRFTNMDPYSFIIYTGSGNGGSFASGSAGDSAMRASGMDPNMFNGFGSLNPSQIALYRMDVSHDQRAVVMAKGGGYFNKKSTSSGVLTTSFRKVRDGYFEIVIDKKLAPGEYAFLVQQTGMASANGGVILFCFGVD
ncbi:MAG TPA: hypothetical protein VMH27_08920 [Puia sp.]|nr:hypothetical protein [Puia sp.]